VLKENGTWDYARLQSFIKFRAFIVNAYNEKDPWWEIPTKKDSLAPDFDAIDEDMDEYSALGYSDKDSESALFIGIYECDRGCENSDKIGEFLNTVNLRYREYNKIVSVESDNSYKWAMWDDVWSVPTEKD